MREKLSHVRCSTSKKPEIQGLSWAWWVFFVQIPFVVWYARGLVPIHPIVVMLPLVVVFLCRFLFKDRRDLGEK